MARPSNQLDDDQDAGMGILGGVLGAFPGANVIMPGGVQAVAAAREAAARNWMIENAEGINLPQFSGDYNTVGYAGDYTPDMYQLPDQLDPRLAEEGDEAREIEMEALQMMIDRANGAADAKSGARRFSAIDDANQLAAAREGAIRTEMERKGQGGGATDAMLRAQSAQAAANRAAKGGLDAEEDAALEKLMATNAQMQGAHNLRGADLQKAIENSRIWNRANEFNVNARNAIKQGNTDLGNAAKLRNLNTVQGLGATNTGIHNAGVDRGDRNEMSGFGAQVTKTGVLNNAIGGRADQIASDSVKTREAAKEGYENFKDIFSFGAGGMGM